MIWLANQDRKVTKVAVPGAGGSACMSMSRWSLRTMDSVSVVLSEHSSCRAIYADVVVSRKQQTTSEFGAAVIFFGAGALRRHRAPRGLSDKFFIFKQINTG